MKNHLFSPLSLSLLSESHFISCFLFPFHPSTALILCFPPWYYKIHHRKKTRNETPKGRTFASLEEIPLVFYDIATTELTPTSIFWIHIFTALKHTPTHFSWSYIISPFSCLSAAVCCLLVYQTFASFHHPYHTPTPTTLPLYQPANNPFNFRLFWNVIKKTSQKQSRVSASVIKDFTELPSVSRISNPFFAEHA